MKLDTITRIERFMQDALLSSPQIPLGVNIVRLAADYDTEGIAAMAYSIVVRYVGSDVEVIREVPLTIRRTLNFELTHAAQSYLTQSGHDYAVQMCAGAQLTLNNAVPINTGEQIVVPLFLTSERFEGLTDSTHYVYVQTWRCQTEEIFPVPPIDPCVWRGNCSYLFPPCTIQEVLPGDVLYGNVLYSPVLPPPSGDDYNPDYCGVIPRGRDLVYKYNESETFLANWEDYSLVSTETFGGEDGKLLIVNIYDSEGEFVDWYFAANCDCRKIIQIAGFQPGECGYLGGLYRSPIGQVGNILTSGGPEPLPAVYQAKNAFGYVSAPATLVYEDPGNPNTRTAQVRYGIVYPTLSGVKQTWNDVEYYLIARTTIGKAWIRVVDFEIIDYDPRKWCDEEEEQISIDNEGSSPGEGSDGRIDPCWTGDYGDEGTVGDTGKIEPCD